MYQTTPSNYSIQKKTKKQSKYYLIDTYYQFIGIKNSLVIIPLNYHISCYHPLLNTVREFSSLGNRLRSIVDLL